MGGRPAVARRLEAAALELFAVRGYEGTTVDDLAAAGGVGRRTFFRYFPTKLDVVLGELDDALAALVRALAAIDGDDPLDAARRAFTEVNRYRDEEVPTLRRRLRLIEDVGDLAGRAGLRYRDWEAAVAADAGRRWGEAPEDLRPQVFARSAVAAMRAVVTVWLDRPGADADALAGLVDEAFAALRSGFDRAGPGSPAREASGAPAREGPGFRS